MKTLPSLVALLLSAAMLVLSATPDFSLHLEMSHDGVKVGRPMEGTLTLTNTSDHDIGIYKDKGGEAHQSGYTIDLRDSQGKALPLTITGSTMFGSGGSGPLKPGHTETFSLDLNKLYFVSEPGAYVVKAKILDDKTNAFVSSNAVQITVTK